jgi:hypothetical protein
MPVPKLSQLAGILARTATATARIVTDGNATAQNRSSSTADL